MPALHRQALDALASFPSPEAAAHGTEAAVCGKAEAGRTGRANGGRVELGEPAWERTCLRSLASPRHASKQTPLPPPTSHPFTHSPSTIHHSPFTPATPPPSPPPAPPPPPRPPAPHTPSPSPAPRSSSPLPRSRTA